MHTGTHLPRKVDEREIHQCCNMDQRRGAAVLLVSCVASLYALFSLTDRFNGVEIKDKKITMQNLPRVANTQRILEAEWISDYR